MRSSYETNTLRFEDGLCTGCGMCETVCPHGVFELKGDVAYLARPSDCMECGACQRNCPAQAISVDAGVGCASAEMLSALTGRRICGCGGSSP